MADAGEPAGSADASLPAPGSISPEAAGSFRSFLTTGGDVVDPLTWAGSLRR